MLLREDLCCRNLLSWLLAVNVKVANICWQLWTEAMALFFGFATENSTKGCMVVWWLTPSSHGKRVPGWGLSVWSLHVLSVYAWVLSGYSGFLPSPKNMHVRLIGNFKNWPKEWVWACVVVCLCVALWWTGDLSRVNPASCLMTSGIGFSPPATLNWIKMVDNPPNHNIL